MARYKLSVDETRNTLNNVEVETDLNETELDALLTKIEKSEIISTGVLIRKLEDYGVEVKRVGLGFTSYYSEAKTLEIEELEEPHKKGFMVRCKVCDLNREVIEQAILDMLIVTNTKKATGHRPK